MSSCRTSDRRRMETMFHRAANRQDVVGVRRISHAIHRVESLGHGHRLADFAACPMKIVDVGGNELAFSVMQGPFPIRSRAFTAGCPDVSDALRYARHVWSPAPSAVANSNARLLHSARPDHRPRRCRGSSQRTSSRISCRPFEAIGRRVAVKREALRVQASFQCSANMPRPLLPRRASRAIVSRACVVNSRTACRVGAPGATSTR